MLPALACRLTFAAIHKQPVMVGNPPTFDVRQGREYVHWLFEKVRKIKKESLVYRHSGTVPDVDPPDESITVEPVTEPLLDRLIIADDRREKFVQFLRDGHVGFVAHDGDALIARAWISTPDSRSVPYTLPDHVGDMDVYWLFHARTREPYRKQGWHTYLVCRRLTWIYDRDPDAVVFTDTTPENVSRHTFESTGFVPYGTMTTYRIGHPSFDVKQFGWWDREADHPPLPDPS